MATLLTALVMACNVPSPTLVLKHPLLQALPDAKPIKLLPVPVVMLIPAPPPIKMLGPAGDIAPLVLKKVVPLPEKLPSVLMARFCPRVEPKYETPGVRLLLPVINHATVEASDPVGPIEPVGPVGPVEPVLPVDPVVPVDPAGPVLPVGPVAPVFVADPA